MDNGTRAEDRALWRRCQMPAAQQLAPDAMLLAAYADGRLDEGEAEIVELWLADHPEAIADLAAARAGAADDDVPAAVIARAMGLVVGPGDGVVPLRRPAPARAQGWRLAAAWSGIAASVLVTSLVGYALANNAYDVTAQQTASQDLLSPPSGLFTIAEDEGA